MSKNLYVVGTGTEVGKTYAAALIAKKLKDAGESVAYFKAAASGCERDAGGRLFSGDVRHALTIGGLAEEESEACPFLYEAAVSPHLAARWEGRPFDVEVARAAFLRLSERYDYVVLEGAGGIFCPMSLEPKRLLLIDIVQSWGTPTLLVSESGLGAINAIVASALALQSAGVELKGVAYNRYHGTLMEEDNVATVSKSFDLPQRALIRENEVELQVEVDEVRSWFN